MVPLYAVAESDPPRVLRGHEMITVLVGPTKEKFTVYENLLRASSQFFRAALNKQWVEGQLRTIEFPEEEPAVFELFVDWLTSGHFDSKTWSTFQPDNDWPPDMFWLNVYSFADRLMVPGLQLQAFDQMRGVFNSRVPTIPSGAFIKALAPRDGCKVIRAYVETHILYWLPKSREFNDWVLSFKADAAFGRALAQDVIVAARIGSIHKHPDELQLRKKFAMGYGLDVEELAKDARSQDEKQCKQTPKALGMPSVPCPKGEGRFADVLQVSQESKARTRTRMPLSV